jgi:hypothetical protein
MKIITRLCTSRITSKGSAPGVIRIGTRRALRSLAHDPPVPSSNAVCGQLDRKLRAAFVSISRVL